MDLSNPSFMAFVQLVVATYFANLVFDWFWDAVGWEDVDFYGYENLTKKTISNLVFLAMLQMVVPPVFKWVGEKTGAW